MPSSETTGTVPTHSSFKTNGLAVGLVESTDGGRLSCSGWGVLYYPDGLTNPVMLPWATAWGLYKALQVYDGPTEPDTPGGPL